MSVSVSGTTITMTRGDTLRVTVGMKKNGEPYTPDSDDKIRFAAKRSKFNMQKTQYEDASPLIVKDITGNPLLLELVPKDTASLGFGAYDYDIQITMADGTVDTFISGSLTLTPEVD